MAALIGLIVAVVAGYIVAVHPAVAGANLPAAVESWLDYFWTSKKKPVQVKDAKNAMHLHASIRDLQVPCGYIIATSLYTKNPSALDTADVNPLETILDPSKAESTISKDVVMKDRYLKLLYEEAGYQKYIPSQGLWLRMGSLEATVPSPKFIVVDDDSSTSETSSKYKMRLGRDFMEMNQGRIDLHEMELYVSVRDKPNVMIPFLQTRSAPDIFGDEL